MTRRGDTICFDTAPTIWGIRGQSSPGQEHEIEKTRRYIRWLRETGKQIMIPAPVLAEYLIGADATEINELRILQSNFQIPSLDIGSATFAAELQRGGKIRRLQDEFGLPRECIKTDALIAAIAIRNGAAKIVTNDERHFRVLVESRIPLSDVPDVDGGEKAGSFGFVEDDDPRE